MHPFHYAQSAPDRPAYIMMGSGEVVTYKQLNDRSNQCAQMFRKLGLQVGDSIAIFMENNARYLEICWAAQRSGLYFTCVSSRLTPPEAAYIIEDCEAKLLITSAAMPANVCDQLITLTPDVRNRLMVDGVREGYAAYETMRDECPATPIADETSGTDMLYSSGTTGRPKGIRVPLSGAAIDTDNAFRMLVTVLYGFKEGIRYLSPAPLYHAAPLRYCMGVGRCGGTVYVMEKFDPEDALRQIERNKITHSQWVPTMFVRMLKLPKDVRTQFDVSSLECAIHAAAPCPVPVKRQMIEWWGPVINEYYAGTEGNGFCAITSEEWLANEGSVGKSLLGPVHICGEDGEPLPPGEIGTVYFESEGSFEYYKDPEKTKESRHPRGWSTLGDIGYVNEDGYLFLTDRKAHMIISGGVNIYPQEAENLLITHPKVMDVAVIGVPNEDFGEEVKAVVQPANWNEVGDDLAEELIQFCKDHLSGIKCPRSIDFDKELPRHATGKLYKRLIRDRYWDKHDSKIV